MTTNILFFKKKKKTILEMKELKQELQPSSRFFFSCALYSFLYMQNFQETWFPFITLQGLSSVLVSPVFSQSSNILVKSQSSPIHSQLVCLEKCSCGNSLSPRHLLYVGFDSQASHVHLLLNALFGKCSSSTGNLGVVLPLKGAKFVLRHSSSYATTFLIWLLHFISNSSLLTFF